MKTSSFAVVAMMFATQALADAQDMPTLQSVPTEDVLRYLNENDMINLFEGVEASDIMNALAQYEATMGSSDHAMLRADKYGDKSGNYDSKKNDSDDGYMKCNDSDADKYKDKYGNKEKYCRK